MQDLGGLLSSSCTEESHGHGTVKSSYLSDLGHQNYCVFSLWLLCMTEEDTSLAALQTDSSRVVDIQLCVPLHAA